MLLAIGIIGFVVLLRKLRKLVEKNSAQLALIEQCMHLLRSGSYHVKLLQKCEISKVLNSYLKSAQRQGYESLPALQTLKKLLLAERVRQQKQIDFMTLCFYRVITILLLALGVRLILSTQIGFYVLFAKSPIDLCCQLFGALFLCLTGMFVDRLVICTNQSVWNRDTFASLFLDQPPTLGYTAVQIYWRASLRRELRAGVSERAQRMQSLVAWQAMRRTQAKHRLMKCREALPVSDLLIGGVVLFVANLDLVSELVSLQLI
jgi:hypothetical protein